MRETTMTLARAMAVLDRLSGESLLVRRRALAGADPLEE